MNVRTEEFCVLILVPYFLFFSVGDKALPGRPQNTAGWSEGFGWTVMGEDISPFLSTKKYQPISLMIIFWAVDLWILGSEVDFGVA